MERAEYNCVVCTLPITGIVHEMVDNEYVCSECVDEVPAEDLIENKEEIFSPRNGGISSYDSLDEY